MKKEDLNYIDNYQVLFYLIKYSKFNKKKKKRN